MSNINDHELIDSYLLHRLNMEEKQEFEKRISSDAEFAREYEIHRKIVNILQQSENNKLRARLLEKDGRMQEYKPPGRNYGIKIYLAIAASVIILLGTYFFIFNYSETMNIIRGTETDSSCPYITKYFKPPANQVLINIRGNNPLLNNKKFILAMKYYEERNYNKAGKLYREIYMTGNRNPSLMFYTAVCDLAINEKKEALDLLLALKQQGDLLYADEVDWYLSLIFIETGQLSSGIKMLYKILNTNSVFKDSVKIVIKDLEITLH